MLYGVECNDPGCGFCYGRKAPTTERPMKAPDLFSYIPPLARRTDPETSHDAARSVEPTLSSIEAAVLKAVPKAPADVTLDEVVEATGLDKVTASPRFKPLEEKGLIVRTGKRRGLSGRQQTSWTRSAAA